MSICRRCSARQLPCLDVGQPDERGEIIRSTAPTHFIRVESFESPRVCRSNCFLSFLLPILSLSLSSTRLDGRQNQQVLKRCHEYKLPDEQWPPCCFSCVVSAVDRASSRVQGAELQTECARNSQEPDGSIMSTSRQTVRR